MTAVLDSIRRIVAEDAAHSGTTHEVYLRQETADGIAAALGIVQKKRFAPPSLLGLPLHIQNVGRDCIATLRGGQIISVTNL